MTDIIKRVWILSAFLWNPPGYTRVVFVVFLIWLEWAEALDFPHLSLGYIWLAKSKYQANYFEKTMFLKWKVVGVLKNGWCCLEIYAKSGGGQGGSEDFSCVTIKFTWSPTRLCNILMIPLHPLTPMSDQNRISPYSINTISSRQVVRIKKNINLEIISWSNTKFSELTW